MPLRWPNLGAIALCLCMAAAFPAAAQSPRGERAHSDAAKPERLSKLYDEYWDELLELDPLLATFQGDTRYNDRLPDFGTARYRGQTHDFTAKWLARVQAMGPDGLSGQDLLSYEIFVESAKRKLEGERFPDWMVPVSQLPGIPSYVAMLGAGTGPQPFKTVADYDNWLKRMARVPAIFDTFIANMREGIRAGVVQPRVVMEKALPQLDAFIADDPTATLFWGPIATMPKDIPEPERLRITKAYREAIARDVVPAYRRLRDFIKAEYLPATRSTVGLSALPMGDAWYRYAVRNSTSTNRTPGQYHRLGLDEVSRIHAELRGVMRDVGFHGDLQAFFRFMRNDPRFSFESEAAMLDFYRSLGKKVEAALPRQFNRLPKAPLEIRPTEAYRARSAAPGDHRAASSDGTRPGVFFVNTYDLPSRKTWFAESLYLHEAAPGHHFQGSLQQEAGNLPKFRRFGGEAAYGEGWALYAESLGRDLGVYTDPYNYAGYLQNELWRAIRLVADTGLHSKGWTRARAIRYMLENSAASETDATSEAERYIAMPGQALAYKAGELKIKELRQRAQRALGSEFDIRQFHAEVLDDGALPLDVLDAKVDRWIASRRSRR